MANRITKRKACDCANVLLELRNGASGLRPVTGIMYAWRKLIGKQGAVRENEEFEAEYTDVVESMQSFSAALLAASAVFDEMAAGTLEVARMPSLWTFSAISKIATFPDGRGLQ